RFCLAPGLADEQLAGAACGGEAGAREGVQRKEGETGSKCEADRYPDDDEHGRSYLPAGGGRGRIVRAGARCPSGTAAPTCSEPEMRRPASPAGRSPHRRSIVPSFALMSKDLDLSQVQVRFGNT